MGKKINAYNIITYIICTIAIALAFFTIYTLLNTSDLEQEKNTNSILGYSFFVVLSGSMEDEFPVGSLIISKEVELETLEVGDIISFISIDPYYIDEVVSHKIRSITEYEGELAYETYGTTTGISDNYPALASKILGEYQFTIPYVGNAIVFIQGEYGFFIFIILPLFIIFVLQLIKLIKRIRNSEPIEEQIVNLPKEKKRKKVEIYKKKREKRRQKREYKEYKSL